MPVIKRKTKNAITKQVKKLVKKHGPEVALGLATTLVGSVVGAVSDKSKSGSKKKSAAVKKKEKPKKKLKADDTKADETPKNKKKPKTTSAASKS